MVGEYSRYYRDSSPVNDHQPNLDIRDDPCVFPRRNFVVTPNIDALFLLLVRYLQYPRFDRRYLHTYFNLVSDIVIYSFRDIRSPWPSHMLQHWMNLIEWARSIFPSRGKNKSRSWCIRLNLLHWKPKRHLISHRIIEWRLMLLMSKRTRWETPRGRYDKHNGKFSLSMKPKFNRPVGERNHFWRLLLVGTRRQLMAQCRRQQQSGTYTQHNQTTLPQLAVRLSISPVC
jgi:hypothetical protein